MVSKTPRADKLDKNYFINGAQEYYQWGGAASGSAIAITGTFDYLTCDRFEMKVVGTWTTPTSQQSTTKVGTKSRRSHSFLGTPTNVADTFTIRQKIESINAIDLLDDVFSIGLKYNGNNFTSLKMTLYAADVEDDFSAVTQIDTTTVTILADSTDQKAVWEDITTNSLLSKGAMVEFEFSGLTVAATSLLTGEFKLNIGKDAQDFSHFSKNVTEELKECKNYFEVIGVLPGGTTNARIAQGAVSVNTTTADAVMYYSEKRVIPIVTFGSANNYNFSAGNVTRNLTSLFAQVINKKTMQLRGGWAGALTSGDGGYFSAATGAGFIQIEAEL